MKNLSSAAAAAKANPKKRSIDSAEFYDAEENPDESLLKNLTRQALKNGSFVSICYPYKFAYCLLKFGYIPKSIAKYSTEGNKRLLMVPSVKEFMDYMKTDEGDWLWMRGEISFCSTFVLYGLVKDCVSQYLIAKNKAEKSLVEEYCESLYVTSVSVFVAVVVTHPFALLSYRQIGQYVGKEETYSSAAGLFAVFTKPGALPFLEGILARYVLKVIPSILADFSSRTWHYWLKSHFGWLRPTLEWCIDVSVYYWVAVALSPLEIASITSSVYDSGIKIGAEPFTASGNLFQRFVKMWNDGRLSRSASYYKSQLTPNIDQYVVL